ncbi:MAG: aldo/keto reductase [Clostridia bacterium]|nr:aldo/keto reductase [Clostridia bacterium]
MIYKEFKGKKLSMLGMGTMRFPTIGEEVDMEKTAALIDAAIQGGVNYFDTAWMYHGGKSESVMGELLSRYPRESFYLASKFPGYDQANIDRMEEIFEKQLEKCRVDYFDFYLFHNLNEGNLDLYLDPKLMNYLLEQKKQGRIRHLGFSVHGNNETTRRFLETYAEHLEFCQVQLNYLDWTYQQAKEKVELLREFGIPVWVMEPVRGGKLAKLREADEAMLKSYRPKESIPAWAFRFLMEIPDVTVILSGMSDMEQLQDNLKTFGEQKPLSPAEWEMLEQLGRTMIDRVPCTDCRYCTDYCPQGLEIPRILRIYREQSFTGTNTIPARAVQRFEEGKRPTDCIGCRACEAVCPQNIPISELMADFSARLSE